MASTVSWILRVNVKDGQVETFRALMEEMVESTKTEPGTLIYEWFIDGAGRSVHIYERYADSAAVLAHGAVFGEKFAERFMASMDPTGFDIYGEPSEGREGGVRSVFTVVLHDVRRVRALVVDQNRNRLAVVPPQIAARSPSVSSGRKWSTNASCSA